jgi:mxaJ protein
MCSRCPSVAGRLALVLGAALGLAAIAVPRAQAADAALRVCADPNNLPFSNDRLEGFENRIAAHVASAMGARLEYVWHAQRRGFVRNTLAAGLCDVVMGVPSAMDSLETTRPYYRSTHVFVTRQRDRLTLTSLDDPRLARLRIGVQVVGDDYASPPPLQALGARGLVRNVSGYSVYGNYAEPNPPARVVEAVAAGAVDVAIVWGPLGGFFGPRQSIPLQVTPVAHDRDRGIDFAFDIAMGVRKGDRALRQRLERVLESRRADVDGILRRYGVPMRPLLRPDEDGR